MPAGTARLRHNRDFALLWTGQVLSTLGSEASLIAFPLVTLAVTGSPTSAGLVGFANTVPVLLLYLPIGVLVDRHDRRAVMLISSALGLISMGALGVVVGAGVVSAAQIVIVAFLAGTATILYQVAETGALPNVVDPDQLNDAIALNEARAYTARLAGPPAGGALFGLGRCLPFVADAASYAAIGVSVLLLRQPLQPIRSEIGQRPIEAVREGVHFLCKQPFLRTCALLIAASNFAWTALVLVLVVCARGAGASAGLVGLMVGLIAVGGLIGSLAAPRLLRILPPGRIVLGIFWASGIFFASVALTDDPIVRGLLVGLAAATGPAWNAVVVGAELRLTPDRLRGRVNAASMLVGSGAMPLGALAGGILSGMAGGTAAVLALAGFELFLGVIATGSQVMRTAVSPDSAPSADLRERPR
jgi:MFS family permease